MSTFLTRPFPPFYLQGWFACKLLQVELNVGRIFRPIHGTRASRLHTYQDQATQWLEAGGVIPGDIVMHATMIQNGKSKINHA